MVAHDVSRELRGYHGRWAKSGILKRLETEASQGRRADEARAAATLEDVHKKVQEAANLPEGKGRGVQGILVANMGSKGIKVRLPGATKHYKDPREAAVAVFRKQHHEEGHSPIPLPGTESPPRAPEPSPSPPAFGGVLHEVSNVRKGETVNIKDAKVTGVPGGYHVEIGGEKRKYYGARETTHAIVRGQHTREGWPIARPEPEPKPSAGPSLTEFEKRDIARAQVIAGHLYHESYTTSPTEHKELIRGMAAAEKLGKDSPEYTNLVKAYRKSQLRRRRVKNAPAPEPPVDKPAPERKIEEVFRGISSGVVVHHPKSLEVRVQANAEDKKRMRQQVLKATTKQAEVTPDLVSRTEITVTRNPHGKRSAALASHTGQHNTLHVKPEVLIGTNAQQVLDHGHTPKGGVDYAWWSNTDKEHDLAMNVLTHEFGHGVHGELNRLGIIKANRHVPVSLNPQENEFWRGMAGVLGITKPMIRIDSLGNEKIDVGEMLSSLEGRVAVAKNIGEYASKNMNEMLAELWTEYRLSSNPRPPAKYFGDFVTSRLAGRGL